MVFTPQLRAWRFYDNGSDTGAPPIAAENTAIALDPAKATFPKQIRVQIQETMGDTDGAATDDWRFRKRRNAGAWSDITAAASWLYAVNAGPLGDPGDPVPNRGAGGLSDPPAGVYVPGQECEDGELTDWLLTAGNFGEHILAFQIDPLAVQDGDVIGIGIALNGADIALASVPSIAISKSAVEAAELSGGWDVDAALSGTWDVTAELEGAIGMTKANQNLSTTKGDRRRIRVTIATTDGTDFAGCSVKYGIALTAGAAAIIEKDTAGLGGVALETATVDSLVFLVTLDPADTDACDARRLYHEAQATLADGTPHTVMTGYHSFSDDVV